MRLLVQVEQTAGRRDDHLCAIADGLFLRVLWDPAINARTTDQPPSQPHGTRHPTASPARASAQG